MTRTRLGVQNAHGAYLPTGLGKGGEWDGGKCGENCASYSQDEHGGVAHVAERGARGDDYQKEDGSGNR